MPDLASLPADARIFVDTNIFVYHLRGKSATASAFLGRVARGEVTAYVNTLVLADLLHKLMLADAYVQGIINGLSATKLKEALAANRAIAAQLTNCQTQFEQTLGSGVKLVPITKTLLIGSKAERMTHGLMTGDSLHLGNMNRRRPQLTDLATYDGDFAHVPGITVWKPMDVVP